MKKLTIIVPVYFNEKSLEPLFQEIQSVEEELLKKEVSLELIFVNDGSKDNSLNELLKIRKSRPATIVINLTRNFGATYATKVGLKYCNDDAFLWIAADLQDPPSIIIDLVDSWLAGSKYNICVRKKRKDPAMVILFSAVYYYLLRKLIIKDFPKGGFDIFLLDCEYKNILLESSKSAYMPILSFWLGIKPKVIEYERGERKHGKSKWTFVKKFNTLIDIFFGFSSKPIRIIGLFGLLVSILSFIYGAYISIYALLGVKGVSGFATIVTIITFSFGLIIFTLGIIGEYISRIFDQVNKRPEVVIDKIFKE